MLYITDPDCYGPPTVVICLTYAMRKSSASSHPSPDVYLRPSLPPLIFLFYTRRRKLRRDDVGHVFHDGADNFIFPRAHRKIGTAGVYVHFLRLFTGRVKIRGSDRIGSSKGDPARPDPTQLDPTREIYIRRK